MSARQSLLDTLSVLKDCLGDPALIDKAPVEVTHNQRAAMLRQGLAVLTFSATETFVRDRTGELLRSFTHPLLTFASLSPALQKAATLGALEGVRFRLKLQASTNKVAWLVNSLSPIARATTDISQLSDLSFGYAASNLVEDDIRDILKAFGVDTPWIQMTKLTRRLGLALLDCEGEFKAMKQRRHASAHALNSRVPHADLIDSLKAALAICLSFDLLLSHCHALCNLNKVPGVGSAPTIAHDAIKLVFVAPHNGNTKFCVRREQLPPPKPTLPRPTVKVFGAHVDAIAYGTTYGRDRKSQVVAIDSASIPINWVTW